MPPRKRKANDGGDQVEENSKVQSETKKKKPNKSKTDKSDEIVIGSRSASSSSSSSSHDPMIECEASSDEFLQLMAQTIKKLKDEDSLRRLFSDEVALKEVSIGIVKHLKQVADEFLVSISQAEMFMKHNDIQAINQDNYCLYRIDIPDIWAIIFSYLPIYDFIHINRVCKLWHQASELNEALVHYDYPDSRPKFEKLFFEKYISFRTNSIKSYNGDFTGIEYHVKKHDIKASKKISVITSLNKDSIYASYYTLETIEIYEKLEKLICPSNAKLLNILSKPQTAFKHFPSLKSLQLSSSSKKTKEIIIAHSTLSYLNIGGHSNVSIKCPMLEICKAFHIDNLTIESKQIIVFDLVKIGQLNVTEPTMAWDLKSLEEVKSIVKLDCPFVKKAYIGHESMVKYLPNLVHIILNAETIGYDCMKKLTFNQLLKEITFKNFKNEEIPDRQMLTQALQAVEYIRFDDCSTEFVVKILESLSKSLRGVTFSKIAFTKTLLDLFDPSNFPNIHKLQLESLNKTLIGKVKTHFQTLLKRMKSINELSLKFAKVTSFNMDIPDHIEQLEIDRVRLIGEIYSKMISIYELPNTCEFNNVEYISFSHWIDLDLQQLEIKYPTLKYLEGFGNFVGDSNKIEVIKNREYVKKIKNHLIYCKFITHYRHNHRQ